MTENTETLNDSVVTETKPDESLLSVGSSIENSSDTGTNVSDSHDETDVNIQSIDTSSSNPTTSESENSINVETVSAEKVTTKRKYTKKDTSKAKTTTDKTASTTSKPTENIVEVVPQDEIKQDTTVTKSSDLSIKVTNSGSMTVVEPMTCTSIKPGETVTIEANSRTYYDQVRKNLAQLQAFGRKLEF